jgi:SAM-dependent methyltransferase
MKRTRERIPECGAIKDSEGLSSESYAEIMRKRLWGEYQRFAGFALEEGRPCQGARLLEIGPGPGWIGIILAKARPDISIEALDASEDMVRSYRATIAKEDLEERIQVATGRAERLGESVKGAFDLVYSRDSLHHWDDPRAAFAAIRGALKEGGALVLQDERRDIGAAARLLVKAQCAFVLGPMGKYWQSSIAAGYTADEVRDFLELSGFRDIRIRPDFLNLTVTARASS